MKLICDNCTIEFERSYRGRSELTFCSRHCAMSSPKTWERRRQRLKEKCGVTNVMQLDTTKSKKRTTMINRYGAAEFPSTDVFLEKRKATWKERYGVNHNSQDPTILKKATNRISRDNFKDIS